MVGNPDRDNFKTFKTIIEAFDQVNKERSHIVNNQGKVMSDFGEKLAKMQKLSNGGYDNQQFMEVKEYVNQLNSGKLFAKVNVQDSF